MPPFLRSKDRKDLGGDTLKEVFMGYIKDEGAYKDYISTSFLDVKNRVLRLHGKIVDTEGAIQLSDLIYMNSKSKKDPIHCYISSYGGSVHGGLALVDLFHYIEAPIYTYCLGHCMSMGAILLSQGTPGHRHAFKHSTIMIHEVSSGTMGTVTDMEVDTKESKRLNRLLAELLSKSTGKSISRVQRDIKKDFFLSAKDALEYGIVDKIIGE